MWPPLARPQEADTVSWSCPALIVVYVLSRSQEKSLKWHIPFWLLHFERKWGNGRDARGNRKSRQKDVLREKVHGMEGFAIFSPLRSDRARGGNKGLQIPKVSVQLLPSPQKIKLEKVNFKGDEA